jgi:hypothetical protein
MSESQKRKRDDEEHEEAEVVRMLAQGDKRKREDEEQEREDEKEAYFARITDFQHRNFKFVQVTAAAVGATNGDVPEPDWPGPDGGWEAEVVRMLAQGYYPNGLVEFKADQYSPVHRTTLLVTEPPVDV